MITGSKKEVKDFKEKVIGVFEGDVVCVNPSREQFKEILGIDLPEESKQDEYLGESKENNTYLRLNFWFKNVKTQEIFPSPISFFLEDKERENKEGTKKQYVNKIGSTTWAEDENALPDWFKKWEYRVAYIGEEEMYNFIRTWLNKMDFRDVGNDISLDWKKLMKGNVKELSDQINGEYCCTVGLPATVVSREKDGEVKQYQAIYNKAVLPSFAIKALRLVDYNDFMIQQRLLGKKPKDMKAHEKFVVSMIGDYGCRDAYWLGDLKEFVAEEFITASDKVIDEEAGELGY